MSIQDAEVISEGLSLEERGKLASKEIAEILKKYHLGLAVNIEGAKDFIAGLKPTLMEAPEEKDVE